MRFYVTKSNYKICRRKKWESQKEAEDVIKKRNLVGDGDNNIRIAASMVANGEINPSFDVDR